jgi:hypothetical protein
MSEYKQWASAPKFSSFKPKATSENLNPHLDAQLEAKPNENQERRHHRRHHRSRSKSQERHRSHVEKPQEKPLVIPSQAEVPSSEIFVTDLKGDVQNLVYGKLHRYDIPLFHRIGRGSVLGASRFLKIDRSIPDDDGIVLTEDRRGGHKREKYAFSRNEKKEFKLLKIRSKPVSQDELVSNPDFIPFPSERGQKSRNENSDSEQERTHYRSIEGKAKPGKTPDDEYLEYASDSEAEKGRTITDDEAHRLKGAELSKIIQKRPEDFDAWLALINHQDSLFGKGPDVTGPRTTQAEMNSIAEIKIHLYEKALEKAGTTSEKRNRLLIGLMDEGLKIWSPKVHSEKWAQILREDMSSKVLWKKYIDFRLHDLRDFSYEAVQNIFVERIGQLKAGTTSEKTSEVDMFSLYEQLIYVVLRATIFMNESGYSEISIAVWQALLEFNICWPKAVDQSQNELLESFKDFWESEVPRLGEQDARGWKDFINSNDQTVPDTVFDPETPEEFMKSADIFGGWALAEGFRASASKIPARTMDETIENDPFRVILWSDIEGYMFFFAQTSLSEALSHMLVVAFLAFCHLPSLPPLNSDNTHSWSTDSFIRDEVLDWNRVSIDQNYLNIKETADGMNLSQFESVHAKYVSNDEKSKNEPFTEIPNCFITSTDSLFGVRYWARSLNPWTDAYGKEHPTSTKGHLSSNHMGKSGEMQDNMHACKPAFYQFIRNALKSLAASSENDSVAEYYLAFEWCNEPQDIKKVAKQLIRYRPTSMKLYNDYALIEWHKGNKDTSGGIFAAALGMRSSLPEKEQDNTIILWKTWAWCFLDDGDLQNALKCILSIANGDPKTVSTVNDASPATYLKAKQHLSSNQDYFLSSGNKYIACIYAECLALLHYLSNTENSSDREGRLRRALESFDNFSIHLIARDFRQSSLHEFLYQSSARLLYHHVRTG